MKKLPIATLVFVFLLSCGDNSVNINGVEISSSSYYYSECYDYYYDYYYECEYSSSSLKYSSSSLKYSSSSYYNSNTDKQAANAVVLTLTYWQTKDTDIGGLDPKIYFKVTAYQNGKSVSTKNSDVLLDAQDIPATWTGSKKSSPVSFTSQADSVTIKAVVIEKDSFSDDDISPGYYVIFYSPFYVGRSGSETLDYGYGLSTVRFNYEFVKQ